MKRPNSKHARRQPVTVQDALEIASSYWSALGPSSRMMPLRANQCASILGLSRELDSLGPADGVLVLNHLATALGPASRQSYYAAFRRALALAGTATANWPRGPKAPRSVRDPLSAEDLDALAEWFKAAEYPETADLLLLLRGTGMRVECEALSWYNLTAGEDYVRVKGKGGHERVLPVSGPVSALLACRDRHDALRRLTYSCHLKRWRQGVTACNITSRLPTPHAVRHHYATEAYRRSGKDLRVVQELLGHADVTTTARYLGVDMGRLRAAVGLEVEAEE